MQIECICNPIQQSHIGALHTRKFCEREGHIPPPPPYAYDNNYYNKKFFQKLLLHDENCCWPECTNHTLLQKKVVQIFLLFQNKACYTYLHSVYQWVLTTTWVQWSWMRLLPRFFQVTLELFWQATSILSAVNMAYSSSYIGFLISTKFNHIKKLSCICFFKASS